MALKKEIERPPTVQGVHRETPDPTAARIPFLDLKAEYGDVRMEVLNAVERVLESQHFILGPEVEALEAEVARLVGCQFAIGCASGTDALLLGLMAMGIGPEDEVITTPFTFVATAGSIARVGARPVFVDIEPDSFNLDPAKIEKVLTPRTRAMIRCIYLDDRRIWTRSSQLPGGQQSDGHRGCGTGHRSTLEEPNGAEV